MSRCLHKKYRLLKTQQYYMSQQELHSNAKMKNKDIKKEKRFIETFLSLSRGDRIRTCDHLVPNQARYRTALHPVC